MLAVLLAILPNLAPAVRPSDDSDELRRIVEAARRPLELGEGELRGAGLEWLVERAGESAFCLVGESHGNRETPLLARVLLERLAPLGYGALALETGPVTTELLVGIAREGGTKALVALLEEQPFSAAFLNWREEVAVLERALALGVEPWGIDQEFVGCCRVLLTELERLARDDAGRARVRASYERAWEGFDRFVQSGDRSGAFMNLPGTGAELDELARALAPLDPAAGRILDEMRASWTVYRHYVEGRYFENNRERVRLLKRHLDERLEELERSSPESARVLLKLGSVHAGRGFSPMDQLDVGNHCAELAAARGSDSFHVYVIAQRSAGGEDFARVPELAPFLAATPAGTACVIDARPLRPFLSARSAAAGMRDVHELCRRYDALVVFPSFSAATDIVPSPR